MWKLPAKKLSQLFHFTQLSNIPQFSQSYGGSFMVGSLVCTIVLLACGSDVSVWFGCFLPCLSFDPFLQHPGDPGMHSYDGGHRTERTHIERGQTFGDQVRGSVCAVFVGMILIPTAIFLLSWNEVLLFPPTWRSFLIYSTS